MYKYGSCINNQLNNTQCYVGVMGDSVNDYSLRQTINNDWTLNQSTVNYNSSIGFPVNSTTVLPDGLCFLFGACSFLPTYTFSYLTGVVYNDANNNGAQDAGEQGIPNAIVHESLTNHFASTDASGNYSLFYTDSSLTYSLSTTPWMYWNVSSSPATQNVNPSSQNASAINFGWYATPNIHDVEIVSNTTSLAAPNSPINFYMSCHNKGTCVESGTVTLTHDSHLNFLSSNPVPDNINGNTITWLYSNLQVLEIRNMVVHFQSDSTIQIGDTLTSYASITAGAPDNIPADNDFIVIQQVVTSFDPNEKMVFPQGDILNNTSLRYTINFQNTGNYVATNIVLVDTLDADLDKSSFELIGYSHPITNWTLSGEGVLRMVFQNIMLPDSNADEAGSHGFAMFRINTLPGLAAGTLIENTADIYFDYNAAVVTNTTLNTIIVNDGILETGSEILFSISPNPVTDEIFVQAKNIIEQISVYDLQGRMIKQFDYSSSANSEIINVKKLTAGTYFISVKDFSGAVSQTRFVKL